MRMKKFSAFREKFSNVFWRYGLKPVVYRKHMEIIMRERSGNDRYRVEAEVDEEDNQLSDQLNPQLFSSLLF